MSLRFFGDWSPWLAGAAAVAAAALAARLYRRESVQGSRWLATALPALRALVVFMAVILLAGPILHHRTVLGERGRVLIFVDGSRSMGLTDAPMEPGRKILCAQRLGLLDPGTLDASLSEAADALARARRAASAAALAEAAQACDDKLGKAAPQAGGIASEKDGVILREVWKEIPGTTIDQLRAHPKFAGTPDQTSTPDRFESPADWGDNYGQRLRGFLRAPADGEYVFWISGDDQCELWVSPDADPAHKTLVARVPSFTGPRQWDAAPEQKSKPIRLTAGRKVYVEALHHEGNGGDHVAVGWQLPDGTQERPIPGARLSAPDPTIEPIETVRARFERELLGPARELAGAAPDPQRLKALADSAERWERALRQAFEDYAARAAGSGDAALREAVAKFDALARWRRAERLLLGGPRSLVEEIESKHHVELLWLGGTGADPIWGSGAQRPPSSLPLEPTASTTNLSDGLKARAGESGPERVAAILLSDGRHNQGGSPLLNAALLGQRGVPIYAVGLGGSAPPEDAAILEVKAPASVFFKDRVKGELVLKDDMSAGRPFSVRIRAGDQTLWEQKRVTEHARRRGVAFDFSIEKLVEAARAKDPQDVEVLNLPLSLKAEIVGLEGDREPRNNTGDLTLHAVTQRRKALLVDGRPRWETRYLRNLLERDEQWEVTGVWVEGAGAKFPTDRKTLFGYDFLALGEVPGGFLGAEQLEWVRDFVGRRGGGLLLLDGRRGQLRAMAGTPVGPLLPVEWTNNAPRGRPQSLRLTEAGAAWAALALSAETGANRKLWTTLAAPHWVAPVKALPGAETMVEAVTGSAALPALVLRRYGAGTVLYASFDETWRWRYEVGDLHHERYWNQAIRQIMEPPFAVRSARVSLDSGKPVYAHGEQAAIRARLREADGRPMEEARAEAWLWRDGIKVATVALAADGDGGGGAHGLSGPLEEGRYEVRLHVEGIPESQRRVKTEFVVRPPEAGELSELTCNEELLMGMADQSGGAFFREEQSHDLPARLAPLSHERVIESDTVLAQSWAWFVPIVALLTVEWILRKRAGLL
jgi:hypothetical protein